MGKISYQEYRPSAISFDPVLFDSVPVTEARNGNYPVIQITLILDGAQDSTVTNSVSVRK
jgi:hypothetical protein